MYPGGLSAQNYLLQGNASKWLGTHNKSSANNDEMTQKTIEFATELFRCWDLDASGFISETELIKPLVSLGLAPDHRFARKICVALDPKQGQREVGEKITLKLDDFLKIFKHDKVSEQLMQILQRETEIRMRKQTKKLFDKTSLAEQTETIQHIWFKLVLQTIG